MFSRHAPQILVCACMVTGIVGSAAAAAAESVQSISPFGSSSFNRTIHGDTRSLDVAVGGRQFGSAQAFVGVDTLSTVDQQYLTSGLQWHSNSTEPTLRLSVLRTEGQGERFAGGQTLVRAANRIDLGRRWYVPDVTMEVAQVSNSATETAALGGRAARIGLAKDVRAASYTLGYFRADPEFNAFGSAIAAGDRGLELTSRYDIGDSWRLSHDLRLHEATQQRSESALVQHWQFSRTPQLTDVGSPWRLSASLGNGSAQTRDGDQPIAVELAAQTARWRSWRFDTSIGWYDANMPSPSGLPMAGSYWRVSGSRGLNIAGLQTEISPSFALGGSKYRHHGLGSRARLALGLSRLSDSIDLKLDYRTAGWDTSPGLNDGDLTMTLNYTQSTSAVWPGLRAVARTMRLPWKRRF